MATKTKRYPVMRKLPASFTALVNAVATKPQPVFEEVEVVEEVAQCAYCGEDSPYHTPACEWAAEHGGLDVRRK